MKTAVTKTGGVYRVKPPARPEPRLQCIEKKGRYLNPDWIQWAVEQGTVASEEEGFVKGATLMLDRSLLGRLRSMATLHPRDPQNRYHVAITFKDPDRL